MKSKHPSFPLETPGAMARGHFTFTAFRKVRACRSKKREEEEIGRFARSEATRQSK